MGRSSVLCLPQPTLKLAQCLGQELFVEEARPPVSNLISGNYAPGPGAQNPLAGASWEGSPPGFVRKARETFSGSTNLPGLLCLLPRCPPQVGVRQPHVPRCAESSRLGPTAGPVWPSRGRLCLSHLGMFVLACVCTCSACVLLFTRAHQGSPPEACPHSRECALLEPPVGICRGWRACLLPPLSPQGPSVYLLRASPSALS